MDIKDNKKLWLHRRAMVHGVNIALIVFIILCFVFPKSAMHLQWILVAYTGFNTLCTLLYIYCSTEHDKTFLPFLLGAVKYVADVVKK